MREDRNRTYQGATVSGETPPLLPPQNRLSFTSEQECQGRAYLIGAGPGAADLITLRGLRLLRQADVVVYDRLAAPELLDEAPPDAERFYVGKEPGNHGWPQEAINALIVAEVRAGKKVVRLKGGDPFVFGRGGEEMLALQAAGLAWEVVPGISSSIAAAALAGVPVTHRGVAASFAVVTGHEEPTRPETMVDWQTLAHVQTLVILMGIARVQEIVARLLASGRDPETPVLVVSNAATPAQQEVVATLTTLTDGIVRNQISAPATIIVGNVVGFHRAFALPMPEAPGTLCRRYNQGRWQTA